MTMRSPQPTQFQIPALNEWVPPGHDNHCMAVTRQIWFGAGNITTQMISLARYLGPGGPSMKCLKS